jgi:Divergent InlB B-repeat domain
MLLTATAATGSIVSWSGNCDTTGGTSTAATCVIININAVKDVTATFTPNQYGLTVNAVGNTSGTVSSNTGGISFSYPTANTSYATLDNGTAVMLTATVTNGYVVTWAGCDTIGRTTSVPPCTITINAAKTVTIIFNVTAVSIGVFKNGTWYIDTDHNAMWNPDVDTVISFGMAGDRPIVK